jgi:hypothetical protein
MEGEKMSLKKMQRVLLCYTALFVLMFVARVVHGYQKYPGGEVSVINEQSVADISVRNYASSKIAVKQSGAVAAAPSSFEQKYEKVAEIGSTTSRFDADEKNIRDSVSNDQAVIQLERKTGNPGSRELHLTIGVKPEKFDSFYEQMLKIGRVVRRSISKTDKTNEFLQLNARRASLEKMRANLLELRSRGGTIDENIKLQDKILEVENELQTLGVQLGNFDEVNEFCTIRISLTEGSIRTIPVVQRIVVAFSWTVKLYILIVFASFLAVASAGILVWVVDKLQIMAYIKSLYMTYISGKKQ